MQLPRIVSALFILFLFTQSRAQIRIPDRLSPASCLKLQEGLCKSLAKDEFLVIFSGSIPAEDGKLPNHFTADRSFRYIAGLNVPEAVVVLSKKEIAFGGGKGTRFIFLNEGTFDPALPVETIAKDDAGWLANFSRHKPDQWDEFIKTVMAPDSVHKVWVWEPETRIGLESSYSSQLVRVLFKMIGPGEHYYAWEQGILAQIMTATESNFQQVVKNAQSIVEYRPQATEIRFIQNARNIMVFSEMLELQTQLRKEKLELIPDPYGWLSKLSAIKRPEELTISKNLADAAVKALKFGITQIKAGRSDAHIQQAIAYRLSIEGCDVGGKARIYTGKNCGYFSTTENRTLADGDCIILDAIAGSGPFFTGAGRTFQVGGAFTGKKKVVYDWAKWKHTTFMKPTRTDLLAGKITPAATREDFVEFLKNSGIKLTRSQESSPVFVQSYRLAGPVSVFTSRPLWDGALIEVITEIRFPASAGYPEEIAGFGILLKDVLQMTEEGVQCLTSGISMDDATLSQLAGTATSQD